MKILEQELKEKELKYFIKSKIDVLRYFSINAKIKLLEHSREIDVSKHFLKSIKMEIKIDISKWKIGVSGAYQSKIIYHIRIKLVKNLKTLDKNLKNSDR